MRRVFSDQNLERYKQLASGTLTPAERKIIFDHLAGERADFRDHSKAGYDGIHPAPDKTPDATGAESPLAGQFSKASFMRSRSIGDESAKHRKAAADHLRQSRNAATPLEKSAELRKAKSYKTMAANQDWLDNERINAAKRTARAGNAVSALDADQRTCKTCGARTMLARVTPIPNADHDSRVYECPACGNVDTALVQFK